ncbi:MAG TPA: MFS transporter, partial [bacterium]
MAKPSKLNRNVVLVSLTSFFTDVSSEMLYPQIQAFVGIILSAQKALVGPVLGLVEGIAESTAGLSKVFFGFWSDKLQKRKSPTLAGYVLSALSKGMLFLATLGWPFVLASRFLDRVGKGIRTAPRDALIAESASKATRGRAFGFHRAMDFAGAAVGVLICYAVSLKFLDPVSGNLN